MAMVKGSAVIFGEGGEILPGVHRLFLACGHHVDEPVMYSAFGYGLVPGERCCPCETGSVLQEVGRP